MVHGCINKKTTHYPSLKSWQGVISMMIMFPQIFIWRGLLTQQEVDAIPLKLKRWIKAPLYFEIPFFLLLSSSAYGRNFNKRFLMSLYPIVVIFDTFFHVPWCRFVHAGATSTSVS